MNAHLLINIIFRSAVVYLFVLLGFRLTGKREVGQMTPFDLVLLLLIANAVQNAMTGPDTSIGGGLVAAGTLLTLNWILTQLVWRNRRIRKLVEGTPTLLIHRGHYLDANLSQEKITREDLQQVLREHGISQVEEVDLAVLEVDGVISVLRKDERPSIVRPHHRIRFVQKKG